MYFRLWDIFKKGIQSWYIIRQAKSLLRWMRSVTIIWKHVSRNLNWYINVSTIPCFWRYISLLFNAKGIRGKEKFFLGGWTSENFERKWDANLPEMERKCWDLLLEELCEQLFCLMDSFWGVIAPRNVNLNWLIKVRSHLDKIEKIHEKVKRKKLSSLSRNLSLKKMVFGRFNEHLPHFQFKSDFHLYCNSQCPNFENLYTLLTINKTDKYRERVNATSQSYRDGINLPQYLSRVEKNNDIVDGTEDLSEPGKQLGNYQDSNTASLNKTRL